MASTFTITFHLLAIALLMGRTNGVRPLPSAFATKLQNEGSFDPECWTALANIRSCSNEIIGFFLNGQSQIDKPCCLSLITIAQHCWPSMLASLGFSPEEVSFLQGYCEKADSDTPVPDLTPTPAPNSPLHLS